MSRDRKKLSYTPLEGAPEWAKTEPSCDYCLHKRDASCSEPCKDIQFLMRREQPGRGGKEYTNEADLEGREKLPALSRRPIYNKFLEVEWIFSPRQLQVLPLLNAGKTRSAVCQELGISPPALSAIIKRVENKYLRYDARRRALVALELKKLMSGQGDDDL